MSKNVRARQAERAKKPISKIPKHGECCIVDKEGNMSDQALHDEIMSGVSDSDHNKLVRDLVGDDWTKEELDLMFPLT